MGEEGLFFNGLSHLLSTSFPSFRRGIVVLALLVLRPGAQRVLTGQQELFQPVLDLGQGQALLLYR
jgi:hypothetical protein